jgi:hypothetical protein
VIAHVGGVPVEELLPLAMAGQAGAALLLARLAVLRRGTRRKDRAR